MPNVSDSSSMISMPPLPISVLRLTEAVSKIETDMAVITRIIQYDPVLTASVIRWANSSWSMPQTPIQNVRDAVLRLGPENILKLAVGHQMIANIRKICRGMDPAENKLWQHSVAAATVVETARETAVFNVPPIAFTAAILHDIGKLLLGRQQGYQITMEKIDQLAEERAVDELKAEREITGTDHVQIGAKVAEQWSLPEELIAAIAEHHQPNLHPSHLLDVVCLANTVTKRLGLGCDGKARLTAVDAQVLQRLGLSDAQVQSLGDASQARFQSMLKQWGGE